MHVSFRVTTDAFDQALLILAGSASLRSPFGRGFAGPAWQLPVSMPTRWLVNGQDMFGVVYIAEVDAWEGWALTNTLEMAHALECARQELAFGNPVAYLSWDSDYYRFTMAQHDAHVRVSTYLDSSSVSTTMEHLERASWHLRHSLAMTLRARAPLLLEEEELADLLLSASPALRATRHLRQPKGNEET